MDTQQSVAETQMSLEEIKEKMPDVYAQIHQQRARQAPVRHDSLGALEAQHANCLKEIAHMESMVVVLKQRAEQLGELIEHCKQNDVIIEFFKRFDNLPVPHGTF